MSTPIDTLVCDSASIAAWQSNSDYDYNRELAVTEFDLWELIHRWIGYLLNKIFGGEFAEKYTEPTLVILGVVILLLIIWFIYRKHPQLFMRVRKNGVPYSVHEDTIYGIDFTMAIETSLSRNDYREATRLLYLQTLKHLSDEEYIDWQLYKTPTEYTYEVKPDTIRTPFRELTNGFLRVRYGNFEASHILFQEMQTLQSTIKKGGSV